VAGIPRSNDCREGGFDREELLLGQVFELQQIVARMPIDADEFVQLELDCMRISVLGVDTLTPAGRGSDLPMFEITRQ